MWCKKEQPRIFTQWNSSFKLKLPEALNYQPTVHEKIKAINTCSERPQLRKPPTAFSGGKTSWARDSTAFLRFAKTVLEFGIQPPNICLYVPNL